ncbi:kinase-like domain-containing protein [Syncephalis fuscata]|nr:kinase-like domain-containing protein [Syncephalis fuscata]
MTETSSDDGIQFTDLEFHEEIGSGLFGAVHRGEYLATEVAIKECFQDTAFDFEKYFTREVDMLRAARHPNVVQFMDVCKHEDRFFIVTEFVSGGNLKTWIEDESRLFPWSQRISFAVDVARALAFLHARNIIHRDIKGENLLVTENNRLKVCDFGFSRIAAQNEDEMKRISYCGTDGYMAPEIMLGMEFGISVDIFSFGVVLCELICRRTADSGAFTRKMPGFGMDPDTIRLHATDNYPEDFLQLAIKCTDAVEEARPNWSEILSSLRALERAFPAAGHVGTFSEPVVEDTSANLNINPTEHMAPKILQLFERDDLGTATYRPNKSRPSLDTNVRSTTENDDTVDDQSILDMETVRITNSNRLSTDTQTTVRVVSNHHHQYTPDGKSQGSIPHRFSVVKSLTMGKCLVCNRRFGMMPGFKKFMECDDCGYVCHRKCASNAPTSCTPGSRLDSNTTELEASRTY